MKLEPRYYTPHEIKEILAEKGIKTQEPAMSNQEILDMLTFRMLYYTEMLKQKKEMNDHHGIGHYESKLQVVRDILDEVRARTSMPWAYVRVVMGVDD